MSDVRLIDANALKEKFADMREGYPIFRDDEMVSAKVIAEIIDNAPTVMVDNCGKCPYYKDRDRDIITEAYNDGYKTAKEDFGNHKLVNNSQELVKDLVKEKSERPQGDLISREALIKDIEHLYSVYAENKDWFYTDVLNHIDTAPTVESEELRKIRNICEHWNDESSSFVSACNAFEDILAIFGLGVSERTDMGDEKK